MEAPFSKSWWVEEDVLLAGCYPGDVDHARAVEKLQRLLDVGVRVFVSLQELGERSPSGPFPPYAGIVEGLAGKMGVQVECLNFPVRDMDVPSVALMKHILAVIKEETASGRCVYVHCWGGHGRTGTVVGCWLRERGLSGREALSRIVELRRHDPWLLSERSPQTLDQLSMIMTWKPEANA